jgi:ribonuclease HI
VTWFTPHAFQVKVNTDGAACGFPGFAGFGGIFRDHPGRCLGCFAGSMGVATAVEAELQAIIHAVSMASQNGWRTLWIECDSTLALHFLSTSSLSSMPWRPCVAWENCRSTITSMHIQFSHIYRKGNQVADCFGKFWSGSWGDSLVEFMPSLCIYNFFSESIAIAKLSF